MTLCSINSNSCFAVIIFHNDRAMALVIVIFVQRTQVSKGFLCLLSMKGCCCCYESHNVKDKYLHSGAYLCTSMKQQTAKEKTEVLEKLNCILLSWLEPFPIVVMTFLKVSFSLMKLRKHSYLLIKNSHSLLIVAHFLMFAYMRLSNYTYICVDSLSPSWVAHLRRVLHCFAVNDMRTFIHICIFVIILQKLIINSSVCEQMNFHRFKDASRVAVHLEKYHFWLISAGNVIRNEALLYLTEQTI